MCELKLCGISKEFQGKEAVKPFQYRFSPGVYGLLGENGAGKTTLFRMVCGVLRPSAGQVLYDGMEIGRLGEGYRARLGYLPQELGYYGNFTAIRFLRYIAALKALPKTRAEEQIGKLLELTGLSGEAGKRIKHFSGGMKRRLGIAQALLGDPRLLVLDEPTAGLDPGERVRFRNLISSLGKDRIVLLSTHIVPDMESIADKILIMKKGELLRAGSEDELEETVKNRVWTCQVDLGEEEEVSRCFLVSGRKNQKGQVRLRVISGEKPAEGAVLTEGSLEDAYLFLTAEHRR